MTGSQSPSRCDPGPFPGAKRGRAACRVGGRPRLQSDRPTNRRGVSESGSSGSGYRGAWPHHSATRVSLVATPVMTSLHPLRSGMRHGHALQRTSRCSRPIAPRDVASHIGGALLFSAAPGCSRIELLPKGCRAVPRPRRHIHPTHPSTYCATVWPSFSPSGHRPALRVERADPAALVDFRSRSQDDRETD